MFITVVYSQCHSHGIICIHSYGVVFELGERVMGHEKRMYIHVWDNWCHVFQSHMSSWSPWVAMNCLILLMSHGWIKCMPLIHERGFIVQLARGFVKSYIIIHPALYHALYLIVHHWANLFKALIYKEKTSCIWKEALVAEDIAHSTVQEMFLQPLYMFRGSLY